MAGLSSGRASAPSRFGSIHLSGGLNAEGDGHTVGAEGFRAKAPKRLCNRGAIRPAIGVFTLDRAEKKELVEHLSGVFKTTGVVVVAHYSGLTVAQLQRLRKQMREAGATVQVSKNRLAKIALEGTDVASIGSLLKGPTILAFSNDPVAAPKVATAFAKDLEKFVILGGAMGRTSLDPNGVRALATLPSLDELRGRIVGLIQAPATKLAQLTTAPQAKLARVFQAYADRDSAAQDAA